MFFFAKIISLHPEEPFPFNNRGKAEKGEKFSEKNKCGNYPFYGENIL